MAKDPAFLFYSSDFLVGTYTMTDTQVGQYVRLMCLQHQHGHLDESTMLSICKLDSAIMAKFKVDEGGCYYNERLDEEVIRRNTYTESRRKNLSSKAMDSHMGKHMDSHMDAHMETETITNTNSISIPKKKGVKGETKHKYGRYNNVLLTDTQLAQLEAEFPDWEKWIETLSNGIESKGYVYKNHLATIRNWARKDNDGRTNNSGNDAKPVSKWAGISNPI